MAASPWPDVAFARRKYGPEILADVGWIHEYETFITSEAPHRLAFHEVLLVTSGTGRLWVDHHSVRVRPGRLLITAPGQARRWRVSGLDGVCVFFATDCFREFFGSVPIVTTGADVASSAVPPALSLTASDQRWLRARADQMRDELRTIDRHTPDMLRSMLHEILVRLDRRYLARHASAPPPGKVSDFLQLLEHHGVRHRRVEDYAAMLGIGAGHLSALVKRQFGRPASAVIRSRTAAEARRRLLYTDASAAAIAEALGFEDPAYFSRFFSRETGMSPTRFRTRHRR